MTDRRCTSSQIDCAFNLTKEPRIYLTEVRGAKPYNKLCRYNGRLYQLGWKIPINDRPCLVCKCNEFWDDKNPFKSLSCSRMSCENELQPKLKEGCLPVYSDTHCCPIDYYCRESFQLFSDKFQLFCYIKLFVRNVWNWLIINWVFFVILKGSQCVFNGTRYAIGSKLFLNFANLCNECICSAPPTFTCTDRYCEQIPDNCRANQIDSEKGCCPTYKCFDNKNQSTPTQ